MNQHAKIITHENTIKNEKLPKLLKLLCVFLIPFLCLPSEVTTATGC